jgi:hypothetical protein
MKTAFAVLALITSSLLLSGCQADSTGRFQSVGGDYGQSWISDFKAANTEQTQQQSSANNSLWNWGTAPRGSMIVNGKLQADPYYYWKSLNLSSGWIDDSYVDPYTGNQVYGYIDPNTGETKYFYMDPNTGKPVYTTYNPVVSSYGTTQPVYTTKGNYVLPSIFS